MQPLKNNSSRHKERGQTLLLVVLGLGLFLLAAIGFGVDYSNAWFHRQTAQAAADAACSAAAMDMLEDAQGASVGCKSGSTCSFVSNLNSATSFDCSTSGDPNSVPCVYAAQNGYSGAGLVAGAVSNSVNVSFPSSIPSVSTPASALTSAIGSHPFIQVDVVDRVPAYFSQLATGSRTIDVRASARCGLVVTNSTIPILVLHPSKSGSLSLAGSAQFSIYGGAPRGIQVNSTSSTAVSGGGTIDLHQGGPNVTGSDLGVSGAETTSCCSFNGGTTGKWVPRVAPVPDPLAYVCAPGQSSNCSSSLNGASAPSLPSSAPVTPSDIGPGTATNCSATIGASGCTVAYHVHGCPDSSGCSVYAGGKYTAKISPSKTIALFDPGLYYFSGVDFELKHFTARTNVSVTGDGNQGVTFYFSGGTFTTGSNTDTDPTDSFIASQTLCSGVPASQLPGNLPAATVMHGTILLGPCTGYYGGDASGQNRGVLFFQNRDSAVSPGGNANGKYSLAGIMYFHHCASSTAGGGTGCSSSAYGTVLSLGGNACGSTYILGEAIADQISESGTPCITMDLSTNASYKVLKASLLQ